jgi:transcriptional regulator with XRE-family HTH domain
MNRNKKRHSGELAETIKGIRLRLGMNMTQFARSLEVTHGQVSRYEAGLAVPSLFPLGRLLELAEGAERNPIRDHLAACLRDGYTQMKEGGTARALSETAAHLEALWANAIASQSAPEKPAFSAKFPEFAPNLGALMSLVSQLCDRKREVDASLVEIVGLWLSHRDNDPAVKQCFADAAQYLNLMLSAKAGKSRLSSTRAKYRIIFPVTFRDEAVMCEFDGVIHRHGDIVELDLETAKRYAYTLRSVEEEVADQAAQPERKKLA